MTKREKDKKITIFEGPHTSSLRGKQKIRKTIHKKESKITCRHDYKNAIKVGNIDYRCPLCGNLVDPNTWFIMNSFNFIDV